MTDAFTYALLFTLAAEGGFVSNAADKGGATNMGITQRTLSTWRLAHGGVAATVDDVKNMTRDEAGQIYKAAYWDQIGAAKVFDPIVALALFDSCVLCGIDGAARVAQRALSENSVPVTIDGKLGPKSIEAINQMQRRPYLRAFCAQRDDRFLDLVVATPSQAQFLPGWLSRTSKIKALTLTNFTPAIPVA